MKLGNVKAGGTNLNPNQKAKSGVNVKTSVKAGALNPNHNHTLARVESHCEGESK
jgi:hypothetical protein